MADLISVKALKPFSFYHIGHGIIHGDPDSSIKEAKNPSVPADALDDLIDGGLVAAPKGHVTKAETAAQEQAEIEAAEQARLEAEAAAAAEAAAQGEKAP